MIEQMVTRRTHCRLCDNTDVQLVLPIKPSPIAEAFITPDKKHIEQPLIPLDLYQCQACGHVQNLDIVSPEVLFRDYIFKTASSAGLIEHFRKYASDVVTKLNIPKDSLIVEIGSNDGTLLRFFKELGMRVVGVDPAIEISKEVNESGVTTIPEFFTPALAADILEKYGPAKLIVANNVYAHCDQLGEMTDGIYSLLSSDGVFVFEVSYLMDIVDNFVFDTVYHEHLSYHSVSPFKRFFKAHKLQLIDIEKISTKGGSMRCFAQRENGPRQEQPVIETMIQEEERRGLHTTQIFKNYEHEINKRKNAVKQLVEDAQKKNQRIVAYGASNTVMTLMYHFELEDKIEYLVDDNARKHGLLSPGAHLPIHPSSILYSDKPDLVLILAWQYADPIIKKHQQYLANGGTIAVPLPNLRIIEKTSMAVV